MNFQNIIRDDPTVKRAFIPKKEALVEFDYSQIEPRMLAYFSAKLGDQYLADVFHSGQDVYLVTAGAMLDASPEDITPSQRQLYGKTGFLSIIYGAGPKRISKSMGLPLDKAKEIYTNFHENLPCVRMVSNPPPRYRNPDYEPGAIERVLAKRGYIELIDGRRITCPQWGEHKMLNYLIQGSAAVVMKRSLVRVWKRQKDWPLYAHMTMTVHDSILMDALKSELAFLSEEMPKLMDEPLISDTVPVEVEMKWSDVSWADVKEYDGRSTQS